MLIWRLFDYWNKCRLARCGGIKVGTLNGMVRDEDLEHNNLVLRTDSKGEYKTINRVATLDEDE